MKFITAIALLVCIAHHSGAQPSKLRDVRDYLSDNNYKAARKVIDEVVKSEKDNAKAWFLHGLVYLQMALDTTVSSPTALVTSTVSLQKALLISPDYDKEIDAPVYTAAILHFNKGVTAYGAKSYTAAYSEFSDVNKLFHSGTANRFAGDAAFAELAASARFNGAYAALYAGMHKEAEETFESMLAASVTKDSNVYQALIEIYQKQNKNEDALATIKAARAQFPASQLFRNIEINHYIASGNKAELLHKLEAAVRSDPQNPELLFNLANAYTNAAFPKDENGKSETISRADFDKAEATYGKVTRLVTDNADYYYNFGVLYYTLAVDINLQMNAIKGLSTAEDKKYDELKAARDAAFKQASPLFEKSYTLLDGKAASLNADQKLTYQNALTGLREIYTRLGEKSKADEVKGKLEASRR